VQEGSSPTGLRPFLVHLFTQVPRRVILRTSALGGSRKFRIGPGLSVYSYSVSCHYGE
jgi:hypothetical protein